MQTEVTVTLINGVVTLAGVVLADRIRASRPSPEGATESSGVIYIQSGSGVSSVPLGSRAAEPSRRPQSRQDGSVDILARVFDPVWTAAGRLRPLRRRVRPWLAAVLGFVFGGIGIILYFRTWTDVAAGVVLVVVAAAFAVIVYAATGADLPFWSFAALPALYGYLRALASNRALALTSASAH